jgi:hypothetical protein
MVFNQKTIQPYRVWYEYLQTALNDENYKQKVNKIYYKDWNLNLVKKLKFNKWFITHQHLFNRIEESIKLIDKINQLNPNTVLVEIPNYFTVQKIQKEIGKAIKGKVAKTQQNQRFKIQSNRSLQIASLDHFLWSYEYKIKTNKTLEEIWEMVSIKQKNRQKRYGIDKRIKIKKRALASSSSNKESKNKAILISRNIKKAKRILDNVCKGIFPGEYAIH